MSATYYRDNFLGLLSSVASRYSAILTPEESSFVASFQGCSLGAQCLLVRLVSRKGPLFRTDKLRYPEISQLTDALRELADVGLVEIAPLSTLRETLDLMTVAELQSHFQVPKGLRKSELLEWLTANVGGDDDMPRVWPQVLELPFQLVRPGYETALARLRLMFFGNLNQDLSEFVLADLGVFRYEPYELDGNAAAFTAREQVDQLFAAIQWRQAGYQALDEAAPDAIAALANAPVEFGFPPARRVVSKGLNQLGRYYERLGIADTALSLYRRSGIAPARERVARILYGQDDWQGALRQCQEIQAEPWDEQEGLAAQRIQDRCLRQLKLPRPAKTSRNYPVETFILDPASRQESSVERQVLAHLLQEEGGEGYYVENWLLNALFGLLFWEVVFAPVPDAFYHPFQRGPVDLYRPEFRQKRRGMIADRLARLTDMAWCRMQVEKIWHDRFGTLNPFVSWTTLDEPRLSLALDRIPVADLQRVFSRMLLDLRNHCSGFPDLIHFRADRSYELIEVKGPGDRVQDHQARWLEFFVQEGIAARVVHVVYATAYTDGPAGHTGSTTL